MRHNWSAVWGSPVQQRQGHAGIGPVKGHKNKEVLGISHDIILQSLNQLHGAQGSLGPVCGKGMVLAHVDSGSIPHA